MKNINTSTFDFPTLIREGFVPVYYVWVNYNHADGVRTADDVKCERAR